MEELGIEEARRQLGEIVDRARIAEQPTRITRTGKPAAVIVSAHWYDTVTRYVSATTFTSEAADFYARERKAGNRLLGKEVDWSASTQTTEEQQ